MEEGKKGASEKCQSEEGADTERRNRLSQNDYLRLSMAYVTETHRKSDRMSLFGCRLKTYAANSMDCTVHGNR